jgi:NAD(P)-dependent dehydrogenase (short-subunit alcohol dehydrogenase family)
MRMNGKVAVVVGAGTGHGTASAIRLALDGARVHVVDAKTAEVDSVVAQVKDRGGYVRGHVAETADVTDLERVSAAVAAESDAVHVLVNHHLMIEWGTFEQVDLENFKRIVEFSLFGPAASTRAFLPLLKAAQASQGASVIHLGSIDGIFGNPLSVAYSAAKGGLAPLTHIMAREFAPFDIRVNVIATGQTNQVSAEVLDRGAYQDSAASMAATAASPGGTSRFPGNWYMEQLAGATPLKRSGPPEEWAGMLAFLASPDSSYVTGQVHIVDCGRTGLTPGTFPWLSPSTT